MDLAVWYPRLLAAGIPTPRTEIVTTALNLDSLLDGRRPAGYAEFLTALGEAGDRIGWPCFLRTGYGSGKHDFSSTCHVPTRADLPARVAALVEWSALADLAGLPTSTWALRELVPVDALFTAFRGLPIGRERRYWLDASGAVVGHHPYWISAAIGSPSVSDWRDYLEELNHESPDEVAVLTALTARVGQALPGAWSVDWLFSPGRGWLCIDLAWAERSWFWEGHPSAPPASLAGG